MFSESREFCQNIIEPIKILLLSTSEYIRVLIVCRYLGSLALGEIKSENLTILTPKSAGRDEAVRGGRDDEDVADHRGCREECLDLGAQSLHLRVVLQVDRPKLARTLRVRPDVHLTI